MIFELREYLFSPPALAQFLEVFEREGLPIVGQTGELVGYWRSESGRLGRAVHLWRYASLVARSAGRAPLAGNPAWKAYLTRVAPLLQGQRSWLLQDVPGDRPLPAGPPLHLFRVFEPFPATVGVPAWTPRTLGLWRRLTGSPGYVRIDRLLDDGDLLPEDEGTAWRVTTELVVPTGFSPLQ